MSPVLHSALCPEICFSSSGMRATVFLMNAKVVITFFTACVFMASPVLGQTPQTDENITDSPMDVPFWQASLPGGQYMVRLDRIASISRHRYLLDGAVIVDEVTVDTSGQALARFYHLTPATDAVGSEAVRRVAERGRAVIEQAAGNATSGLQDMVVKKYPETTHAGTIEYRIQSAAQLIALYNSLRTAWETGRGREINIE